MSEDQKERQERLEREIVDSRAKFDAFIRDAAFAYGELDLEGRITSANRVMAELTGCPAGELVGRKVFEFLDEQDQERAAQDLVLAISEPNDGPREYRVRRGDGKYRHVDINALPLKQGGELVGFYCTGVDVTDRHVAEVMLQQDKYALERQYRATIEAMADGIHLVDEDMRLLLMNRAFVDLGRELGLDMTIGGKTVFEVFPFLPDKVREEYDQVFATGEIVVSEEELEISGRRFVTETRKIPILEDGVVARVVTVVRDFTERRRAREAVERQNLELKRANEQLEQLHRAKDEFIATISHELRTPLVTGVGYIDLLLEGELGAVGDEAQTGMRVAQRNLRRLSTLIDDLLSYHSLTRDDGRSLPAEAAFDASALIKECRDEFLVRADRSADDVVLEVPDDLPLVLGDEELIRRVISNLLNNADQHAGDVVRISLKAEPPENGRVRLSVSDDGIGMSEAVRDQAFQPFFKAAGGSRGAGLGLAIVHRILSAHGSAVKLESEEGQGAQIAFQLSVAPSRSRVRRRTNPPLDGPGPGLRGQATILVVDDDEDTLEFLEFALSSRGYRVKLALSAESALRVLEAKPMDLVLLDMSLPGMDGDELCARIREDPARAKLPVIMLSARAEETARARAEAAGCDGYLVKPLSMQDLLVAIVSALAERETS